MKTFIIQVLLITLFVILTTYTNALEQSVNLTAWHEHRRHKRFLIFQDGGIVRLGCAVSLPVVGFPDRRLWRQLTALINLNFQFSEPTSPIYWWNKFDERNFKGNYEPRARRDDENRENIVDEAQLFLYELFVQYLVQRGMNGEACLSHLICDNAQVHDHDGLFVELLKRILIPHKSLSEKYVNAYNMGKYGVDCGKVFPNDCKLSPYLHTFDRRLGQSFVN